MRAGGVVKPFYASPCEGNVVNLRKSQGSYLLPCHLEPDERTLILNYLKGNYYGTITQNDQCQ